MAEIVCLSLRLRTLLFAVSMIAFSLVTPALLSKSGFDIYLDPKGDRVDLNIGYTDWKTWIVMIIAFSNYGLLFYAAIKNDERLIKIWLWCHAIAMPLLLALPLLTISKLFKSSTLCTGELVMGFMIGYVFYVYMLSIIYDYYKHICDKKAKAIKSVKETVPLAEIA